MIFARPWHSPNKLLFCWTENIILLSINTLQQWVQSNLLRCSVKLVNAMRLNGYPNLNITELWYASACPRFYTLMKMGTFGHIPEFKVFTECPIRNTSKHLLVTTIVPIRIYKFSNTHCSYICDACKSVYIYMYMVTLPWLLALKQSWEFKYTSWLDCCILVYVKNKILLYAKKKSSSNNRSIKVGLVTTIWQ